MIPLRAKREALEDAWRQGLSGQSLLRGYSKLADEFIQECFLGAEVAGVEELVSLVALGGYGRQELFPYSDIDLMVLFRQEVRDEDIAKIADAVFYPLWDAGFEVGHGVRTVEEAMALAEEDFYFRVAMLDARLLCGSQLLYFKLLSDYREKFVEGQRRDFVETMKRLRLERREKFGSHSYLLEPHIKESKGGLRDIQAMLWTAKVMYGLEGMQGLVNAGILTEEEHDTFITSWDMLVRVRNRLHYVSGRKNDQLYFEQQEEIAEAFDYKGRDGSLGVEVLMQEMYSHLQNIAVVTDLFFAHVDDVLGLGTDQGKLPDKVVEAGIELRNNGIHLTASSADLQKKPHLLLRLYLASARYDVPVHHRSSKMVSANLNLINDKVRSSARAAQPFMEILEKADDVVGVLGSMLESGLLTAYVPEFSNIYTLAQHDLYHIYTVDRHSLHAIDELQRVIDEQQEVYEIVASSRVLYLAALLHDVGKGSGKDHSQFGAEIAFGIGQRMGLSEEECEDLSFVVRQHLFMPENALRRDLNDIAFVKSCAEMIGTASRLAMLYLLAIADSRATGPSAWSEWKAQLLQEMYLTVRPYLELSRFDRAHAGFVESQHEQGILWLRQQVGDLLEAEADLRVSVNDLTDDYLLSFTPETVVGHVVTHRDNYRLLRQKSLVFATEKKQQWSLLIMSFDQPGLLAKICGVLALNNLTVLNAQIFTWSDGTVVDVLDVMPSDGLGFDERDWHELNVELDRAIAHRLGLSHRLYKKLASQQGRKKELISRQQPRITIDNETSSTYTVIEVYGREREGQLYRVTQTLADFGINIFKAFIATEVEWSIDVFYVLDRTGTKIEEDEFKRELTEGLLHCVGN